MRMLGRDVQPPIRNARCLAPSLYCRRRILRSSSTSTASESSQHARYTNAFVSYDESSSLSGTECSGRLGGMPIAVKDNICTKKLKTTCGSMMLKDFVSPYDATLVRLLHEAGARIVGKTNCDEFGMGSYNIHTIHGPVINPFQPPSRSGTHLVMNERRSAGGSSGGSAAAVASGSCFAAISTDTGGSTRLPAAFCCIAGLKPSYGLISRWGVVSYADSLDCVGIMARTSKDISILFDVLAVHDPKDPTSASNDLRKKAEEFYSSSLRSQNMLDGLVVGIPQEYFPRELDRATMEPLQILIERLRLAGANIMPVSLPSTAYALSAYYVIASAEASSNLAKYSGVHYGLRVTPSKNGSREHVSQTYSHTRSAGFGNEVRKRILLGTYALSADAFDNYFLQAQRIRNLVKRDFDRVFRRPSPLSQSCTAEHVGSVDVLLHPSAVGTAPSLDNLDDSAEIEAYVQDVLTVPASLAGLPALSVPAGLGKDGWPLGVSIVGQWGYDKMVLKVGEAIDGLLRTL